jgi:hypothetical protein
MTLHATRDGQKITINGNTGVSLDVQLGPSAAGPHLVMQDGYANHVRITEDVTHVRYFWGQLGRMLDEAEAEARETDS